MQPTIDRDFLLQRFLSYVRIETTSCEDCEQSPSSECQWKLARVLAKELEELGLERVHLDDHAYVYGELPERLAPGSKRAGQVPVVAFLAHMDASPAVSGKDVEPIVHEAYDGGSIALPGDPSLVLTPEEDEPLGECEGLDIVTSDGTTLLGADDKSGIAIIMAMIKALRDDPSVEHGPIRVAFTPDEEVGRGVDHFDLDRLGAEVAYTLDGEGAGQVEDETFCADTMILSFHGINVHPGYAKGKMVNSIKLAAELVASLPADTLSPETTEGREGYVHPMSISGNEELSVIKMLIRDFTDDGLKHHEALVEEKARAVEKAHPGSRLEIEIKHSYKNMKSMLDQRPEVLEFALEASRAAGLAPVQNPIRGGTDGARLSFMGLPTPNLSAGGFNFHGKKEWVPVQYMEKGVEVCLHLIATWLEKGEKRGLLPKAE